MIIGISGNNGAGKDTFGMLLQAALERKGHKVQRRAFADALYFISTYLFNTPTKADCDATPSLKNRPYLNVTVRDILILIGKKMREIDPDVWVNLLKKNASSESILIITDVRFQNEAAICDKLLRVFRNGQDENVGECFGETIENNGSLDDLQRRAEEWIVSSGLFPNSQA